MTRREHELTVLLREIYADAVESLERTKRKKEEQAARGDTLLSVTLGEQIRERERAVNRMKILFRRHGFDPEETEENTEE